MNEHGILIEEMPDLNRPVMIAGFDGWGNALKVVTDILDYLISQLDAVPFGRLHPDAYYRLDQTRPLVSIVDGVLEQMEWTGGIFYAAHTGDEEPDVVLLKAYEPMINWHQFTNEFLDICRNLRVRMVITLGSLYDRVLHSDRIVSGMASGEAMRLKLQQEGIRLISYQGPSAIHSLIQVEGARANIECLSLWGHCPYYLKGTSHFGLVAGMCTALARLAAFSVDISDLEKHWRVLFNQIQEFIEAKPELREMITRIRKQKIRETASEIKSDDHSGDKVIDIREFLKPM